PSEEELSSQPQLGKLTASHITPTSVQLEWTVPEGTFDSFTVQYKDAQGQPQVLRVDGESRTVTVPDLAPSHRYKFNLYGVWGRKRLGPISTDVVPGEGGCGHCPSPLWASHFGVGQKPSQGQCSPAPPEEESPSPPRLGEVTASHITPSSIQLEWTVPEGTFDSFTVQYKDAQGQPQALAVDGGSRMVTVPNLVPSRRYKFNLYGVWERKRIGLISTEVVTDGWMSIPRGVLHCAVSVAAPAPPQEEPPSPPRLGELMTSHVTPGSIQLEWTVPEGTFDSFMVQYKDAQGQPQVLPVDGGSRTVTVT
ncbi:TENX protein, partial [Dromaius novaehollandiae]|nr:TENX protein [Dromaius novaehollandiae]